MDTTGIPPTKTELTLRWGGVALFMTLNYAFWWGIMSASGDASAPAGSSDLDYLEGILFVMGIVLFLNAPPVLIAPKRWFTVGSLGAFIPTIAAVLLAVRHHFLPDWKYALYACSALTAVTLLFIVTPLCLLRKHLQRRREQHLQEQRDQEMMVYPQQDGVWPPTPILTELENQPKNAKDL